RTEEAAKAAVAEALRAMRLIRANAKVWIVGTHQIARWLCSWGGEESSSQLLTYDGGTPEAGDAIDQISSRPDWLCLVYPGWTPRSEERRGGKECDSGWGAFCGEMGGVINVEQSGEYDDGDVEEGWM